MTINDKGLTTGSETFRFIVQQNSNDLTGTYLATDNFTINNNDGGSSQVYSPESAVAYAEKYANYVASDGYFWEWGDISAGNPASLVAGRSVPTGSGIDGGIGDDCAHFVSCCIGSEPNDVGGGLSVPHSTDTAAYGDPSAPGLTNWLLNSGTAVEVSSISDLSPGDVIAYNWSGNSSLKAIDHVALYLGNGNIAAHSASRLNVAWDFYSSTESGLVAHFLHIVAGNSNQPSVPASPVPLDNATLAVQPTVLDWANSSNATSYDIYVDGAFKATVTSSQWTCDESFAPNVAQTWQAVARNGTESTTGPIWHFTVGTAGDSPTLAAVVAPNEVFNPGASVSINFTVDSPVSETVLLGATIINRDSTQDGTQDYLGAPTAQLSLQAGANTFHRLFTIPTAATGGSYNLLAELWQDNNADGVIDTGDTPLDSSLVDDAFAIGYSPQTINKAYGVDQLSFGGISANGSGQTIALIDYYNNPNIQPDLSNFDSFFKLPAPPSFQIVDENGNAVDPKTQPSPPEGTSCA